MIIISLKYISSDLKRYNKNSGVKWSEIGKKLMRENAGEPLYPRDTGESGRGEKR